jgi:hypothetical protein
VAAEPTVLGKIAVAAGSAAAVSLVRKLLERGVEWMLEHRPAAAPPARVDERAVADRIREAA